jgi:Ca2+-dependent lipid-binding protein
MYLAGSSDPYFILKLGDQQGITQIILKSLSPTYDQTFTFIVDENQHLLWIEGYDKDAVGKDDPLGMCELDLNTFVAHERKVEWYPLKHAKQGEIRLLTYLINLTVRYA